MRGMYAWLSFLPRSSSVAAGRAVDKARRPNRSCCPEIILSAPPRTRSIVSRNMRLRVTSGAFLYSSIDLKKAGGLTVGFGNRLLLVGFRTLEDTFRITPRPRHNLIRIPVSVVLQTHFVGTRGLHISKRINHFTPADQPFAAEPDQLECRPYKNRAWT